MERFGSRRLNIKIRITNAHLSPASRVDENAVHHGGMPIDPHQHGVTQSRRFLQRFERRGRRIGGIDPKRLESAHRSRHFDAVGGLDKPRGICLTGHDLKQRQCFRLRNHLAVGRGDQTVGGGRAGELIPLAQAVRRARQFSRAGAGNLFHRIARPHRVAIAGERSEFLWVQPLENGPILRGKPQQRLQPRHRPARVLNDRGAGDVERRLDSSKLPPDGRSYFREGPDRQEWGLGRKQTADRNRHRQ